MNLNHLALFQSVAASASISAGAKVLHLSQSAVSKQLGELERSLGLALFERLPRGVRLTDAGRVLQAYANNLVALEADAEGAMRSLKTGVGGRLRMGASRTIGAYLLPAFMARFRERHPEVELSLAVDSTASIEQQLAAGAVDVAFTEGVVENPKLAYQRFASDELVLIAAPNHPVARLDPAPLSVVQQYPLVMHEVGSGTRAVTERAFQARQISLRPAFTLGSTEAIKQTVATGAGIAFLSAVAVRAEVTARQLACVRLKGLTIKRPLYRILRRGAWTSPALSAFLRVMDDANARA
ncbi:MAG TPA: LysR family transcriptional regulator [Verrucomicrobiae bacterium]|nr:LysR family transcriptional regulator [Verrucomicrobiae bacterium]